MNHRKARIVKSKKKRVVKMLEDSNIPGRYRVEIWTGGENDLIFEFNNKEDAQKRFDDEKNLRGF